MSEVCALVEWLGDCPYDAKDGEALELAIRSGNIILANKIEADIKTRHTGCLGTVESMGALACGQEHGNYVEATRRREVGTQGMEF